MAVLAVKQWIVNLFDKNKFKQIIFSMEKVNGEEKGGILPWANGGFAIRVSVCFKYEWMNGVN